MKDKKNMLLSIVAITTLLVLVVGATYAYFTAQTGAGAGTGVNVTTSTTDNLTFNTEGEITIHATPENFGKDGENLSDSAKASATLRANNATNNAASHYNIFLNMTENNFEYTTEEQTAELILTITDPNGEEVTELTGYEYVTVNGVSGFDITTISGQMKLASKYEIIAEGIETHEWNVELTFVNLDSDQEENTGKTFSAELLIQKSKTANKGDAMPGTLAHHIISQYGTDKALYYHDENLEGGANDMSYRYSGGNNYGIASEYADEYLNISDIIKWHCELPDTTELVNQLEEQYPQASIDMYDESNGGYCYISIDAIEYTEDDERYLYSGTIDGTSYWYLDYNESARFESREESTQQAKDDGYIYTVDNYICFGSDEEMCSEDNLYRIIGVFDNKVKLIKNGVARSDLLGTDGAFDTGIRYKWTLANTTVWSESVLNTINLNTNYLNNIGEKWSDMIALSSWSVNGISRTLSESTSPKNIYDAEMTYDAEHTAKIGLQYVSDAIYAHTPNKWNNNFVLSYIGTASWLDSHGSANSDFTITRVSDSASLEVYENMGSGIGMYNLNEPENYHIVRPVFYLAESVLYDSGTGTIDDPIRIS